MSNVYSISGMLPHTMWIGAEAASRYGLPEVWSIATRRPVGWMISGKHAAPLFDEDDLPR